MTTLQFGKTLSPYVEDYQVVCWLRPRDHDRGPVPETKGNEIRDPLLDSGSGVGTSVPSVAISTRLKAL